MDGVAATRAANTLAAAAGIAERAAAERVEFAGLFGFMCAGTTISPACSRAYPVFWMNGVPSAWPGIRLAIPAIAAWKLVAIVSASVETVLASVDVACALVTVVLAVVAAVVKPSAAVRAANGLPSAPPRLPSADFPCSLRPSGLGSRPSDQLLGHVLMTFLNAVCQVSVPVSSELIWLSKAELIDFIAVSQDCPSSPPPSLRLSGLSAHSPLVPRRSCH